MKLISRLFLILGIIGIFSANALTQPPNPVSWKISFEPSKGKNITINLDASIESGWNIYSCYIDEGGPIPTEIKFEEGEHFELEGKIEEDGNIKEGHDEMFDMNLIKISENGRFSQKIKWKDFSKPIYVSVTYMTCNDTTCLPPKTVSFNVEIDINKQ